MVWVWIFLGIAATGLVVLGSCGIALVHKASDLFGELKVLGERAAELAELAGELHVPTPPTR